MHYVSHPIKVSAYPIGSVSKEGDLESRIKLENGVNIVPPSAILDGVFLLKPGDYYVVQEDGYSYFSPKEEFERKYYPVNVQEIAMMQLSES